jgi:hypothetical protein
MDLVDGFHLYDHFVVHNEIDAVTDVDGQTIVPNGKQLLALEGNTRAGKFMTQAHVVHTFEQARSQGAVHAVRSTEDRRRRLCMDQPDSVAGGIDLWSSVVPVVFRRAVSVLIDFITSHFFALRGDVFVQGQIEGQG